MALRVAFAVRPGALRLRWLLFSGDSSQCYDLLHGDELAAVILEMVGCSGNSSGVMVPFVSDRLSETMPSGMLKPLNFVSGPGLT